ncbi:MAG TPA: dual specificity protein phosphatase family protein [Anaerolineales bacterium]|nr:dual specificity protein phosphatase family protein [Anaerolineales bacterium]HNN14521.1 dual specificity protein phosphatase family protein [Anaerolineales bacterium]
MIQIPITESYWVEEARFLAGEYPASHESETARQRLEAFMEAGIRTFIDLTMPHELPSYQPILKDLSHIYDVELSYQRFAIRDHDIPSLQTMSAILNSIDGSLQEGKPVYIHCWGGIGRTGTVVGCYFVRHGLSAEQALKKVDALFRTRPQNYFFHTSPETDQQFEFVRRWREVPGSEHRSQQRFCEG